MKKTFRLCDTHEHVDTIFEYDHDDIEACEYLAFFECYDTDKDHAAFLCALETLDINETHTIDEFATLTRVS